MIENIVNMITDIELQLSGKMVTEIITLIVSLIVVSIQIIGPWINLRKKRRSLFDEGHRKTSLRMAIKAKCTVAINDRARILTEKEKPLKKRTRTSNRTIIFDDSVAIIDEKKKIRDITRNLKNINRNLDTQIGSIVDELYKKKKNKTNYALIFEVVGIAFYYCTCIVSNTETKIEIIIFLYGSFILVLLSKALVSYRIKKGYYGMNFDECKELMKYIMNDIDRNNIDKGKKIFNETNDYGKTKEKDPVIIREPQY